jgi:hypothetical protein
MPDETDGPPRSSIPRGQSFGDIGEEVAAMVSRIEPIELRPTVVGRIVLLVPFAVAGFGLSLVTPLLAVGVAAAYVGAWLAIGRRRVVVDHEGVTWRGIGGSGRIGWADVEHYRYWSGHIRGIRPLPDRLVDAGTATVVGTRHHLVLQGDGRCVVVDSSLDGAERAVGRAFAELHPRLRARGPLDFAPFAILDAGLHHAQHGLLPWVEVEKIALSNELPPRLRVMKHRKAFAWASEKLGEIRNGMLLLEELAERGIAIDPGHQSLITEPMLSAMTRSRALPTATARDRRP